MQTIRQGRTAPVVTAVLAVLLSATPSGAAFAALHDDVCAHAASGAFDDVEETNAHAAAIDCIAAYTITLGVRDGVYAPADQLSRAQMATLLVRFLERAHGVAFDVPSERSGFVDIAYTIHADNIEIAHGLGITVGVAEEQFAPDALVTRAQMASFVAAAIQHASDEDLPAESENAFVDDNGDFHERWIDALAAEGVIRGVDDERYHPNGLVQREQMATFLAHAAGYLDARSRWAAALPESPNNAVIEVR